MASVDFVKSQLEYRIAQATKNAAPGGNPMLSGGMSGPNSQRQSMQEVDSSSHPHDFNMTNQIDNRLPTAPIGVPQMTSN